MVPFSASLKGLSQDFVVSFLARISMMCSVRQFVKQENRVREAKVVRTKGAQRLGMSHAKHAKWKDSTYK